MSDYVSLHNHTCYSLLDGLARIPDIVARAKELGMPALAITDHGSMYGILEFYKECKKQGVKPILGCEVYVIPDRTIKDRKTIEELGWSMSHLVLLARTQEGYQNLLELASDAQLQGFYFKPRVDHSTLKRWGKGLIALSACLEGEIPKLLMADKEQEARDLATMYRDTFDAFYIEVQDNGMDEQEVVNARLEAFAAKMGLPLVLTNDVHYIRKEHRLYHDCLLGVQIQKTITDETRMRLPTDQFFLKGEADLGYYGPLEAILNTRQIAEMCEEVKLPLGERHLPPFPVPQGYSATTFFLKQVEDGFIKLIARGIIPAPGLTLKEYEDRKAWEIEVICSKSFESYFLLVADYVNWAKNQGILVGPARGSGGGSLVARCLNITAMDPVANGMLFGRFLNPGRNDFPDIDTDFEDNRRSEVLEYVKQKFGADRVCQIATFGMEMARAVLKDVGKYFEIPMPELNLINSLIPQEFGKLYSINEALEASDLLRQFEKKYPMLFEYARFIEGLPRQVGIHASGVVVADDNATKYFPLCRGREGEVVSQFDMDGLKEFGLLKFDFLGVKTLTMLGIATRYIEQNHGKKINLYDLPTDDPEVYKLLRSADSLGLFQVESDGMKDLLKSVDMRTIRDIADVNALFRPGPMQGGATELYKQRRAGYSVVEYTFPELEGVLKESYGLMIYQDQVMKVAQIISNYSEAEADSLRKAMGSKKKEIMDKERDVFVNRAVERGYEREPVAELFEQMAKFSGYGFNLSHSVAYSLITYWTAFLKVYFPNEFFAALLTLEIEQGAKTNKTAEYVKNARTRGVKILPPDISYSSYEFTCEGDSVRFGLGAIQNVGAPAISSIIAQQPFVSLEDFFERVEKRTVNSRVVHSLILSGAMDGFTSELTTGRLDLLRQYATLRKEAKKFDATLEKLEIQPEKWGRRQALQREEDLLKTCLHGHPLDTLLEPVDFDSIPSGKTVKIMAMLESLKEVLTKRQTTMTWVAFSTLEGLKELPYFGACSELPEEVKAGDLIRIEIYRSPKDALSVKALTKVKRTTRKEKTA